MTLLNKFMWETKIDDNYDPYDERETGCYSRAFKDKYILWLENKVTKYADTSYLTTKLGEK